MSDDSTVSLDGDDSDYEGDLDSGVPIDLNASTLRGWIWHVKHYVKRQIEADPTLNQV